MGFTVTVDSIDLGYTAHKLFKLFDFKLELSNFFLGKHIAVIDESGLVLPALESDEEMCIRDRLP